MITTLPTAASVAEAAAAVAPHVRRTPVLRAEVDGRPLVLKLEHLQRGGSFKLRGAVNALATGPRPEHVVTASGGNHGIAVATAAALAAACPPRCTCRSRRPRARPAGSRQRGHGSSGTEATYGEAAVAALAEAQAPGVRYVPAYDDPAVVAGQGTVTAEAVADAPEVDAVVVAAGGGGLSAGAVLGAGGRTVVVVEPENCCCVHRALEAGRPVDSAVDSVAASALGATRVGEVPFAVLSSATVVSVLVTDAELLAAQDRLWEEFRLAVEPAAAVPFAAWLAGRVPGERACLVLCGAN